MEKDEEVEWIEVLREINRGKWIIIFFIILGVTIAASMTLGLKKDDYQAITTMVINKEAAQLFYEEKYTQGDITMYEDIINTYTEIARSNTVIDKVVEQFPQYSREDLEEMMTQKVIPNTLILELKVKGKNQADVALIANAYGKSVIETCYSVMPAGSLNVVDEARMPNKAESSGLVVNIVTGMLLGIAMALAIIFIRRYKESTKVMKKEQIQSALGIEVWRVNY